MSNEEEIHNFVAIMQDEDNTTDRSLPTFVVRCLFQVIPDLESEFRQKMNELAKGARTQSNGCLSYNLTRLSPQIHDGSISTSNELHFMFHEKWMNQRCYDSYLEMPFVLDISNRLADSNPLVRFPQITMWEKVNGFHQEGRNHDHASSNHRQTWADELSGPLYLMTRQINAKPEASMSLLRQILCRLANLSVEKEDNCVFYDVHTYKGEDAPTQILEIAAWKSSGDYILHTKTHYARQCEGIQQTFVKDSEISFWEMNSGGLL